MQALIVHGHELRLESVPDPEIRDPRDGASARNTLSRLAFRAAFVDLRLGSHFHAYSLSSTLRTVLLILSPHLRPGRNAWERH
jgi:hypothetical protein